MENGLIGEFAGKKINELLIRIHSGDITNINKGIQLIGDERIKGYLVSELSKENKELAIKYYEYQIERLRNE